MANDRIEGKYVGTKVNGVFLRCQGDATYTITINTETDDPCKKLDYTGTDLAGVVSSIDWEDASVSSANWTLDVTQALFFNEEDDEVDIEDEVINKDNAVFDVQFVVPANGAGTVSRIMEGSATLTSIAIGAPSSGKATKDLSFQGKGKPTWTKQLIPTA